MQNNNMPSSGPMLGRAGSSEEGPPRPRRGTKRPGGLLAGPTAKGSSAERRRNLRNERMSTIEYVELVARLTVLVTQKSAPRVTLEEISQLYQRDELRIMLKENGLSYHRPGDRHSNQMQNKGEMAQQLFDIIAAGHISKLKHAAVSIVRTSAGAPPKPKADPKRPVSTTPDMLPLAASVGPPVLRLGDTRQLCRSSYSEDSTDAEEPDVVRLDPKTTSAPRQPPIFVRKHSQQRPVAHPREEQHPIPHPQCRAQPCRNPPPRPSISRPAPVQPQQPSFARLTTAPVTTAPAKAIEEPSYMVDEPPVLLPMGSANTVISLMSPPTVPSGVVDSNERADPSLGCHALGLARRGSFEMIKLSETARIAASSMPRNCSIQNLTLMEESDNISLGTSWTDSGLDAMMGEAVGILRSPSTCRFDMTCP